MKILIIDDDRTVCSSLKLLLNRKQFEVDVIHQPNLALDKINSFKPSVILLDMNFTIDTSGKQGLKLLKLIRESYSDISVILMTGWATVQLAVEGMKVGAKDFIAKPWDNKELIASINNIVQLYHNDVNLSNIIPKTPSNIIGNSHEILEILDMVDRVAKTDASVLITGESGTGKELIAEAIHQKSHRSDQAFVKVNLGGVPNNLFESEMFGHKKGAFTGAHSDREGRFLKASNGTIFLDEIGELSLDSQVKMLRVLQEKTFEQLGTSTPTKIDVRVISATNRDIRQMSFSGAFREDLFYRINLIHIHLPPLRERKVDIPLLANYFIKNISELYTVDQPYISDATFDWLSNQEIRGNIRQLKNIIERTFLLNLKKKELNMNDFLPSFDFSGPTNSSSIGLNLQEMEIEMIKKALAKYNHSISAASKALGITRSSLYRRLEKFNITHEPKI